MMSPSKSSTIRRAVWLLPAGVLLLACLAAPRGASPTGSVAAPTAGYSAPSAQAPEEFPSASAGRKDAGLVQPDDFQYLGAFRLPAGGDRPATFEYGGAAMTFFPAGDPGGAADGFPGSLFIMGHDRLAYGEMPNGNLVAEVTIPAPEISRNLESLNRAEFLQEFTDVTAGAFIGLDEIPRAGMLFLDAPATGPVVHLAWSQHLLSAEQLEMPSHAWFAIDLKQPGLRGFWRIGAQSPYSTTGYLLEIPNGWADANTAGRVIGTGRYRDGGWSGMGPALHAYLPWQASSAAPEPSGTRLEETVLLQYASSMDSGSLAHSLAGYQHADEWEGGAWITTAGGKSVLLFAGTKGVGERYWYGYQHPTDPAIPCVETAMIGDFELCRRADGSECGAGDYAACEGITSNRGWWSSRFAARFLLYDPADLARVASGAMEPWEPQPYASLDLDEHLFLNPGGIEEAMLGRGVQRRFRIGEVGYDRAHDLLYVLELFADGAAPVVHVWRIR